MLATVSSGKVHRSPQRCLPRLATATPPVIKTRAPKVILGAGAEGWTGLLPYAPYQFGLYRLHGMFVTALQDANQHIDANHLRVKFGSINKEMPAQPPP